MAHHQRRARGLAGRGALGEFQPHVAHALHRLFVGHAHRRRAAAGRLDVFRRLVKLAVGGLGDGVDVGVGVDPHAQLDLMRIGRRPEGEMRGDRRGIVVDDEIDACDRLAVGRGAQQRDRHRHQRCVLGARRRLQSDDRISVLPDAILEHGARDVVPARFALRRIIAKTGASHGRGDKTSERDAG